MAGKNFFCLFICICFNVQSSSSLKLTREQNSLIIHSPYPQIIIYIPLIFFPTSTPRFHASVWSQKHLPRMQRGMWSKWSSFTNHQLDLIYIFFYSEFLGLLLDERVNKAASPIRFEAFFPLFVDFIFQIFRTSKDPFICSIF